MVLFGKHYSLDQRQLIECIVSTSGKVCCSLPQNLVLFQWRSGDHSCGKEYQQCCRTYHGCDCNLPGCDRCFLSGEISLKLRMPFCNQVRKNQHSFLLNNECILMSVFKWQITKQDFCFISYL